jgi:prepilin-type N-terminal cleavage/methylation domain-containing protein
MRKKAFCRSGFTLIELLVVVTIIVVLVSILLPALAKARKNAWQVVCLSNFRQIAIAIYQYANDYNGYPPPGYTADMMGSRSPNNDPVQILGWPDPPKRGYAYIQLALLYYDNRGNQGVYLKDFGTFHCPANQSPYQVTKEGGWLGSGKYSEYCYRLGQEQTASNGNANSVLTVFPIRLERVLLGTAMASDCWYDAANWTIWSIPVPFHDDCYNVSYIDGSAKTYKDPLRELYLWGSNPFYAIHKCWGYLDKAY